MLVLKSVFNRVAGRPQRNPQGRCFPGNLVEHLFTGQPQATVSGKSKVRVENCSFNAASTFIWRILKLQKQPPELFYKNRYLRHVTLSKKRLWHRCFPMNFGEIFKNIFLTENLWTTASETHFELAKVRVVFCEKGL